MKYEIKKVALDLKAHGIQSTEMLAECIPGCTPVHHALPAGSELSVPGDDAHHILFLFAGEASFATDGNEYTFHERTVFTPDPKKAAVVTALSDAHILEIRWAKRPGEDDALAAEYKTQFPLIQVYRNSKQYRDRNKSDKTISRSCIDQRRIPRFALGSVETYGFDAVKSHDHPMLDQFFFSFEENDMDVLIDFEPVPMKGCELLYIPLGSMHGVDVPQGSHCHYLWIDFYPDNDEALKRLDASHIPTGKHAEFDARTGERA